MSTYAIVNSPGASPPLTTQGMSITIAAPKTPQTTASGWVRRQSSSGAPTRAAANDSHR
jgi:hypothetical protein